MRFRPVRLSSAILLLATACATPAPKADTPSAPLLQGAWRSSLQFSSGAFASIRDLEFMYVFNQGGTMTESSNYDGAPPVPPAYGVWRQTGPSEYELKYEFYITAPSPPEAFKTGAGWLPSGRGVFTEKITMGADGKSFTSAIRYEAFDPTGAPMEGGGEATGRGMRIEF